MSASDAAEWQVNLRQWSGVALDASFAPASTSLTLESLIRPGAPTVLAFWATYCPPCLEEIPMFNRLFAEQHRVVGVSLDADNWTDVRGVLETRRPRYPQVVLNERSMKAAGKALEHGLPLTLVTDSNGRPKYAFFGKVERPALLGALRGAATP